MGQIRFVHIQSDNLYFVKYVGLAELYMNGQLLAPYKTYPLTTGSSLRNQQIAPVYYSDVVSLFVGDLVKSRIVFEANHITYQFKNGAIGLHDVGFTDQSGRLVGIMGASGAGKSTLLNVLNGASAPTKGQVLINGIDIHSDDPSIEGIIGFVSQDDLLIEELSVYQNLYYNAKLCFDNYTEEQLVETVHRVLKNLGLFEIRDIQVGSPLNKKISGGQRKRLNIALELIREPAVLFLDEPTSGLSSRDSENILDLLKELTFKGKLVFVVIHQPSSDIFKMFDRLLILDTGGFLIYNGNPIDSIEYFKSKVQAADWNESECPTCGNVNPEPCSGFTFPQVGHSLSFQSAACTFDLKYSMESMGFPLYIRKPPVSRISSLSNILNISDEGWWITTNTSLPLKVSSFSRSRIFSLSRLESPEVGSSRKRTAGSRISSSAIFSLFRCPPLIFLFSGEPTCISLISNRPRFFKTRCTVSTSCSSL